MLRVASSSNDSILAICGGVLSDLWSASTSYPWLTAAYLIGPLLLGGLVILMMDFRPRPGGLLDRLRQHLHGILTALGITGAYHWAKQRWLFQRPERAAIAFALLAFIAAGSFLGWKIITGTKPLPYQTASDGPGPSFYLTDQTGRKVTADSFKGKYALVSFGYTFCPDVCPTTLNTMSTALDILGDGASNLVAAFITIDPQRDTVEALRAYVSNFNPKILGLTGTPENIRILAKAYHVYYARAPGSDPNDPNYLMEHTAGIFFIDPDGRVVRTFVYTASPDDIAAEVKAKLPPAPTS